MTVVYTALVIVFTLATNSQAQTKPPSILGTEAYEAILQFYQYDQGMPLDARVVEKQVTPTYVREKSSSMESGIVAFPDIWDCPRQEAVPIPVFF